MNDQDKNAFEQIMVGVGEVYSKEITKPLLRIYFASLQRFTLDQVSMAATAHVSGTDRGASFFPKPGDLIRKLEGSDEQAQQSIEDKIETAWATIYRKIGSVGPYFPLKMKDKQALEAVKAICGWASLCSKSEQELTWLKKEFASVYDTFERTPIDQLPQDLPGLPELKKHKAESKEHLNSMLDRVRKQIEDNSGND